MDKDITLSTNDLDDNKGNNFLDYIGSLPTKNTGYLAYEIERETKYGGTLHHIFVSGATF